MKFNFRKQNWNFWEWFCHRTSVNFKIDFLLWAWAESANFGLSWLNDKKLELECSFSLFLFLVFIWNFTAFISVKYRFSANLRLSHFIEYFPPNQRNKLCNCLHVKTCQFWFYAVLHNKNFVFMQTEKFERFISGLDFNLRKFRDPKSP